MGWLRRFWGWIRREKPQVEQIPDPWEVEYFKEYVRNSAFKPFMSDPIKLSAFGNRMETSFLSGFATQKNPLFDPSPSLADLRLGNCISTNGGSLSFKDIQKAIEECDSPVERSLRAKLKDARSRHRRLMNRLSRKIQRLKRENRKLSERSTLLEQRSARLYWLEVEHAKLRDEHEKLWNDRFRIYFEKAALEAELKED